MKTFPIGGVHPSDNKLSRAVAVERFALPDEVREERRRRFMEVQAEISLRKLARRIGRIEDVIIDEEPDEDGVAVGRTKSDAPDIDGVCYVTTDRKLVPGDIVPVRITANEEHDLVGREVVA